MTTTTENTIPENDDIHFDYINREEAIFILGFTRLADCINCPDFSLGCEGNPSHAQIANTSTKEYIYRHRKGTEPFLCGKLRNIIIASETKFSDLNESFDRTIKDLCGYLEKDFNRCIVNTSKNDRELHNIEIQFHREIKKLVHEYNNRINILQEQINIQEQTIENARQHMERQRKTMENINIKKVISGPENGTT
jgi:hypothetical protein